MNYVTLDENYKTTDLNEIKKNNPEKEHDEDLITKPKK